MIKNYYKVLGIDPTDKLADIKKAYTKLITELEEKKNNNGLTTEQYDKRKMELEEVYSYLSEKKSRDLVINEVEKRKKILRGTALVATGAVIGVIGVNIFNSYFHKKSENDIDYSALPTTDAIATEFNYITPSVTPSAIYNTLETEKTIEEQTAEPTIEPTVDPTEEPTVEPTEVPTIEPTVEPTIEPTVEPTEEPTVDPTSASIVNNPEIEIDQNVNELLNELNTNGIYNLNTGAPYTFDELKNIVLYRLGMYVGQDEIDVATMVDKNVFFANELISWRPALVASAYHGGEESFEEEVKNNASTLQRINLVDKLLVGNIKAKTYLNWLEDKYYSIITTTDRNLAKTLFEESIDSVISIIKGRGFELNGVLYTKDDFLGLNNLGAANLLQLYMYRLGGLKNETMKDIYYLDNSLVSATENNEIYFSEFYQQFNFLCADDLLNMDLDDEGYVAYKMPELVRDGDYINDEEIIATGIYGHNFSYIIQVYTYNRALNLLYSNNLSNRQHMTLTK